MKDALQQKKLQSVFAIWIRYTAIELEDNGHPFEYASTPWDLFACDDADNSRAR